MLMEVAEATSPLKREARLRLWSQLRFVYVGLVGEAHGFDSTVWQHDVYDFEAKVPTRLAQFQIKFESYVDNADARNKFFSDMNELRKAYGLQLSNMDDYSG